MLLCTVLRPFICVSRSYSVLTCPVYIVSGQDNELLAVQLLSKKGTTSTLTLPVDVVSQSVGRDPSLLKHTSPSQILSFFAHSLLQIKPQCAKSCTDSKGGGKKQTKKHP